MKKIIKPVCLLGSLIIILPRNKLRLFTPHSESPRKVSLVPYSQLLFFYCSVFIFFPLVVSFLMKPTLMMNGLSTVSYLFKASFHPLYKRSRHGSTMPTIFFVKDIIIIITVYTTICFYLQLFNDEPYVLYCYIILKTSFEKNSITR